MFFAPTRTPNGAVSYLDPFETHSLRITRHVKVRNEATAFDFLRCSAAGRAVHSLV